MPNPCFSYTADGALGATNRSATQRTVPGPRQMPVWACFSYYPPAGPPRTGNQGTAPSNLPGLREMPGSSTCFRY